MKIILCGDIHGRWKFLEALAASEKPDIILQCGDFGYWPKFNIGLPKLPKNTRLHWCDGNHEDFGALKEASPQIASNIFYQPRGSYITINNKTILFMGGAYSIDEAYRTLNIDYFKEEIITQQDIDNLPDIHVDVVISHTYPMVFGKNAVPGVILERERRDPSRFALDIVYEKYHPKYWFFGHWHNFKKGKHENCHWICANMAPRNGWWHNISDIFLS